MAEYIDKEAFLAKETKQYCSDCERRKGIKNGKRKIIYEIGEAPCRSCGINDVIDDIDSFPTSDDVKPVVYCTNVGEDYAECDQFVCSNCGIELRNWFLVERDDDDGDETYHEYTFNFCPNCGAENERIIK